MNSKASSRIENYLILEDADELNWILDDNRLEVLLDFILYLRESPQWQKLEKAFLQSGGRVVTETDADFNEDNWEIKE